MDSVLGQDRYKVVHPPDGRYGIYTLYDLYIFTYSKSNFVVINGIYVVVYIFFQGKMVNGSWNGMVGSVVSGQADIVAADLTMTSKRAEVLHFTVPFLTAHVTVVLKKERRRGGRHGEESGVRAFFCCRSKYFLPSWFFNLNCVRPQ